MACFVTGATIERALAAGVPFEWVAADSVYGVGEVEMTLRRAGKKFVMGVNPNHHFHSWQRAPAVGGTAEQIAAAVDAARWQRLSAGEGTKGPRLHDWAYCDLADLDVTEHATTFTGLWTRGLLIRRNIANGETAFFATWCPVGTTIEMLVKIEGTAKNELGLDHNETRPWHGWHRHVPARHAGFCHDACHPASRQRRDNPKNTAQDSHCISPTLIRWSIQEIRRIAVRLAQQRIEPAYVIAWSNWRRAHQAAARKAHAPKLQL